MGGIRWRRTALPTCWGFKSCPRVGGILRTGTGHTQRRPPVSSRAPVWGASFAVHGAGRQRLFQVVPPCGGHLVCSMIATMASWFQVVPPCGGHLVNTLIAAYEKLFQVVPPCGGHQKGLKILVWEQVSSRAPVWGASYNIMCALSVVGVSSRAPVWGASVLLRLIRSIGMCFKSCPRVGGI